MTSLARVSQTPSVVCNLRARLPTRVSDGTTAGCVVCGPCRQHWSQIIQSTILPGRVGSAHGSAGMLDQHFDSVLSFIRARVNSTFYGDGLQPNFFADISITVQQSGPKIGTIFVCFNFTKY